MLIYNTDYMDFPLPELIHTNKTKYRIYGTGEVAGSYYRSITSLYGENCISCFIDSSKSKTVFNGKKVLKVTELERNSLNNYIYLLGTYTSESSMRAELIKAGVDEKNIIDNRFSISSFENIDFKIRTISIYPVINTIEQLEVIDKKLKFFLPTLKDSETKINIFCSQQLNPPKSDEGIVYIKSESNLGIESTDLILVWDKKELNNKDIIKNNNVYCIDPGFFQLIDLKVLISLNKKLINREDKFRFNSILKNNYLRFYNKYHGISRAYVFGNGPLLASGIKKIPESDFKKSVRVVCNGSINNEEIIKMIKPNVYVISDINHFIYEMQDQMERIVDYIMNNECTLFVPNYCYMLMVSKYKNIKNKIIGISEDSDVINFPTPDNMTIYAKAHNVITRFSVPIASSLSNNVIIIGCDGVKMDDNENKSFSHYANTASAIWLDKEPQQKNSYYIQHYMYFKELVEFGEIKGIRYISLTKSYIPVLEERYCEDLSQLYKEDE